MGKAEPKLPTYFCQMSQLKLNKRQKPEKESSFIQKLPSFKNYNNLIQSLPFSDF